MAKWRVPLVTLTNAIDSVNNTLKRRICPAQNLNGRENIP